MLATCAWNNHAKKMSSSSQKLMYSFFAVLVFYQNIDAIITYTCEKSPPRAPPSQFELSNICT